ncbi:hypothetical protein [Rhodovulum euryhalinum]|uniref:Uncharacterized protein n=1 Tax=Rhodovulum euryhalinum TaxID=35805 RepID=A0A4R2KA31_9RHOB|nr:hypothetical protein [Rhodovulum euryhalinum]TCO69012.1 hypothetical protein EV655_1198 [Rhodovulum euryhalinum]
MGRRNALTLVALALAGCADPVVRVVERPVIVLPPAELRSCAPEPAAPVGTASQRDADAWAGAAILAGRDCRETLEAAMDFLIDQDKPKGP